MSERVVFDLIYVAGVHGVLDHGGRVAHRVTQVEVVGVGNQVGVGRAQVDAVVLKRTHGGAVEVLVGLQVLQVLDGFVVEDAQVGLYHAVRVPRLAEDVLDVFTALRARQVGQQPDQLDQFGFVLAYLVQRLGDLRV
eukprot:CAMPEP_0116892018 /NCGR_PEP_ID=MMETSP0467-20121206/2322_1 /TAXON_ID=283647 /ORGANISM="Mesodinium pulex, Strain SPMC105" /LENGTH=136 /DNA_ID=CAMNT_0004560889 /DNA_START=1787 /DNA_END=2197 /DNA_ORIENTATION=+